MLYQVDGVYFTPCPVSSCPAYEPNSGSFFPKPINKCLIASRGADIVMQSSEIWAENSSLAWKQPGHPMLGTRTNHFPGVRLNHERTTSNNRAHVSAHRTPSHGQPSATGSTG